MFITLTLLDNEPVSVMVDRIAYYGGGAHNATLISFDLGHAISVRETPAEIAALIAAEERKRDRLVLAGRFMAADIASGACVGVKSKDDMRDIEHYAKQADVLLAALDAKEGV